jgi:hypothetical protein
MPRPRLPEEHGTERGFQQHKARKTMACAGCLVAHASHERSRARGRLCAPGLGWPLEARRA